MCRLCLKIDTFYICVKCVKNSLKTTRGRNLLRRLIIDSIDQLKKKLEDVKSSVILIKHYTEEIKNFHAELECYVLTTRYLQYLINRSNYSFLNQFQYSFNKPSNINWSDTSDTIKSVRRLLTVLIKHCPRILNHAAKNLKDVDECLRIILANLKISSNISTRSLIFRNDIIKTGCSLVTDSIWRGKPLPVDYQEDLDDSYWDPFFEDLPVETEDF